MIESPLKRPLTRALSLFALLTIGTVALAVPAPARAAEIVPFQSFNQSPLVQIYGLPAPGSARILPAGKSRAGLALDLASNFAQDQSSREDVVLDGESVRATLSYQRGIADRFEAGLELPLVSHGGGFLDGFIEGWHRFFQLPNGGRPLAPRNRLLYRYRKDGEDRFSYRKPEAGVGDLRLTGGTRLIQSEAGGVALRAALKLPTGDSAGLSGSGSTDLALWCTGQRDYRLKGWGGAAWFGTLGGLAKTQGEVLRGQERYLVGFGSLGVGWSPTDLLGFKLQLSSHTPFYRGSDLPELDGFSSLLMIGGTLAFTKESALDIGVSEDVMVNRSPDVAFHLALTTTF